MSYNKKIRVSTPIPGFDCSLGARELEALRHLATGLTNKEIATRMGITHATVRTTIEKVYKKLDVSNRVEAALTAMEKGLLEKGSEA